MAVFTKQEAKAADEGNVLDVVYDVLDVVQSLSSSHIQQACQNVIVHGIHQWQLGLVVGGERFWLTDGFVTKMQEMQKRQEFKHYFICHTYCIYSLVLTIRGVC